MNPPLRLFAKCGHCGAQVVMPIEPCAENRLCAICPACNWHKRIGHLAPPSLFPEHKTPERRQ